MVVLTDMLPGGYWDSGGVLHRQFELGNMTGREEELLVRASGTETSSLVSAVLSRCVRRLGGISPVTEDVARHLLIADRQYLLLKLRQSTFGDVVRADLFCPWAECGRRISLEFSLADLPVQEATERAPVHTFTLSALASGEDDPVLRAVSFRLPNGSDQEAVSGLLAENEAEMERVAPKIELNMETACPECGRSFAVPFDLQRLFFGELRTDSELLYRQVHYLAYHYHWAEPEIMAMPRIKRQKYIELLAGEIERLNDGE